MPSSNSSFNRWIRPGQDTWLGRLLSNDRHPDVFECGLRVTSGQLDGYGPRWRYRPSTIDKLVLDAGVRTLFHGSGAGLALRIDAASVGVEPPDSARSGHLTFAARAVASGADVVVSASPAELWRFGIDYA